MKTQFIFNKRRSPKILLAMVAGLALVFGCYPSFAQTENIDNRNNPYGYEDESQEDYEDMDRENYQNLDDEKSININDLDYKDENQENYRDDDNYDYRDQDDFKYRSID